MNSPFEGLHVQGLINTTSSFLLMRQGAELLMNARLFQLRPTTKGRNEFLTKKKCNIHKPVKHVQRPIAIFCEAGIDTIPGCVTLHSRQPCVAPPSNQ